jgi:hypothetical protein
MGSSDSKPAVPQVAAPRASGSPVATTDTIDRANLDPNLDPTQKIDLFRDGRYRVASKEAQDMFFSNQPSAKQQDSGVVTIDNKTDKKEILKYLNETEGLALGSKQKLELSQQWRFFLASDPIQHGIDCGMLAGCVFAAASLYRPHNRQPMRIGMWWCVGFATGMLSFPMAMLAFEEYNLSRINKRESEMFTEQRKDFYDRVKNS